MTPFRTKAGTVQRALPRFAWVAAAAVLLAPVATAGWEPEYRFSARDARGVFDWRATGNGTFAFATSHENAYLLFETVNETGARTSTLVRTLENVERAALVTLKGRLGILWSEFANEQDADGNEIHRLYFAYRANGTSMVKEELPTLRHRWIGVRESEDGKLAYFHTGRGVEPLNLSSGLLMIGHSFRGVAPPEKVLLGPGGELHGVRWGLDGAWYAFANATRSFETRVSEYWDYQTASITLAPDGEVGLLLGDRREGCELWRAKPLRSFAGPKLLERCPLVLPESGFGAWHLTPDGLVAQVAGGFWDGRPDRTIPFTCSATFSSWTIEPDGSQHLVGEGPAIWRKEADPAYEIVADPPAGAPTGLAATFTLRGEIPQGASVAWDFGDGEFGKGADARHIFLKPGNFTVTVDVKTDPCTDGPGARASLPYRATGSDLSARATTPTKKPALDADALNDTLEADTSFLPAPGAALVAPALAAAALWARRKRA